MMFYEYRKRSTRVLDDIVIRFFPDTFVAFIEKTASEQKDKSTSQELKMMTAEAKQTKNPIDKQ